MSQLERELRNALGKALQNGASLASLADSCGVDRSQLSRFYRHERTLQLDAAGRLAGVLGLKLAPVTRTPSP